jgi:branched-chain amino acid transport system substrate-binding protein
MFCFSFTGLDFQPLALKEGKMKSTKKIFLMIIVFCCLGLLCLPQAMAFEPLKGDFSTFDPNKQTFPTKGDTINAGIFDIFSGPNAYVGQAYWLTLGWVAQDINSQGGILVDGKRKKIQIIKMDTQARPAPGKRAAEKGILQDKVNVYCGTAGSHVSLVGSQVAEKYKKAIYMNWSAYSDKLQDAANFTRYSFRTCGTAASQGKSLAYFYAARSERKFYILAQDYLWGHSSAAAFKKALKEYRPEANIVGEEYHPVFCKDFAPYMEKIKASGAEVIVTFAWGADNENVIKQSRQLGLKSPLIPSYYIPICSPFLDDTRPLEVIGGPAGRGLVLCVDFYTDRRRPSIKKLTDMWNNLWKTRWSDPYNTALYQWPGSGWFRTMIAGYWYFDVLQRAGSTDPEKIIPVWEGDRCTFFGYDMYMRPDDHQSIADRPVAEMEFPNAWDQPNNAAPALPFWVPAKNCMPIYDEALKGRVKK